MKHKWIPGLSLILVVLFTTCAEKSHLTAPNHVDQISRQIIILYTNDEHGWMEATENSGGAAGMMGLWRENEGYVADSSFIILSGGDMWTGPAISTWFQGESMTEVMNAMAYSAAAIGNHEFDFGVNGLQVRLQQADFPFLSANIREKTTGNIPAFSTPYVIREVNGVRVGIIGLTTTTTPVSTFPDNVKEFDFIPYEDALREVVPQVRAAGAQLLVVAGHICAREMRTLATTAAELGIAVIGGGHCHERVTEKVNGVTLIESGADMQAYARAELSFDMESEKVVSSAASIHDNTNGPPDPQIAAIVADWQTQADAQLSQVIGYVEQPIGRNSTPMHNMVTDSWLVSFPSASVSVTNRGGIRQDIPAGDITLGTMVGVLPFENVILELDLTGNQLLSFIENSSLVVGGMTTIGGYTLSNGQPIVMDSTYKVLTTDYLYAVTDNLALYDPAPYNTAVNYRQPVIDWIRSLNTSTTNPLDRYLDTVARQ